MNKDFHISDVLSVTTGHLVSTRHMDGVYDIMNFLFDDNLTTIGLAVMADTAREELLEQHPDLKNIQVPEDLSIENYLAWLSKLYIVYGEYLSIEQQASRVKRTLNQDVEYAKKINPRIQFLGAAHDGWEEEGDYGSG